MLLDEARFFGLVELEKRALEEIEASKRAITGGGSTYYLLRLSRTGVKPGPDGPSADFSVHGSDVCSCLLWESAGTTATGSPTVAEMERLDYELANFLAGAGQQLSAELDRLYRMGFRVSLWEGFENDYNGTSRADVFYPYHSGLWILSQQSRFVWRIYHAEEKSLINKFGNLRDKEGISH